MCRWARPGACARVQVGARVSACRYRCAAGTHTPVCAGTSVSFTHTHTHRGVYQVQVSHTHTHTPRCVQVSVSHTCVCSYRCHTPPRYLSGTGVPPCPAPAAPVRFPAPLTRFPRLPAPLRAQETAAAFGAKRGRFGAERAPPVPTTPAAPGLGAAPGSNYTLNEITTIIITTLIAGASAAALPELIPNPAALLGPRGRSSSPDHPNPAGLGPKWRGWSVTARNSAGALPGRDGG